MPKLGAALDFAQLEGRNIVVHNGTAPAGPVKGQLYFNNVGNELFYWDGTIWQSAKSGAGSSGPPSGPAGGELAGTYPNPTVKPLAITDAHVAGANKDGITAGYSMRRLIIGNGSSGMPGDARLNQITQTNNTSGDVALNGYKLIGLATPTVPSDAATMGYVDGKTAPDATTSTKGIVQLAGDLAGTAASPQIAAGVITDAEVAAANKDGAAGTPSLRTLGTSAGKALNGNTPLSDMFGPIAALNVNNQKVTQVADPTADQDAANKRYVDNIAQGLDAKASVKVATTANITLSGAQTIDGVSTSPTDRVLVKDQTNQNENGIYSVAAGAWTRTTDLDLWLEVPGAFVFVERGTVNADTGWVSIADSTGGPLGASPVIWSQFSSAGTLYDGSGLVKSGNVLNVGGGAGITVGTDSVSVANNGITNAMIADGAINLGTADVTGALNVVNGGTGATSAAAARAVLGVPGIYTATGPPGTGTTWSIPASTHLKAASRANLVQVAEIATNAVELPDVVIASSGDVTITWGASVTLNTRYVTIIG